LSRLCRDASGATIASTSVPFFAAARTISTPTTTLRLLTPSPTSPRIRASAAPVAEAAGDPTTTRAFPRPRRRRRFLRRCCLPSAHQSWP
jgi:hypothetical protein